MGSDYTLSGRRSIRRKVAEPDEALAQFLEMADRLLTQRRDSKNKLYSLLRTPSFFSLL